MVVEGAFPKKDPRKPGPGRSEGLPGGEACDGP
jgi:hypothetical protein